MHESWKVSSHSQKYLNTSTPEDTLVFDTADRRSFTSPKNATLKSQKISSRQSKILLVLCVVSHLEHCNWLYTFFYQDTFIAYVLTGFLKQEGFSAL